MTGRHTEAQRTQPMEDNRKRQMKLTGYSASSGLLPLPAVPASTRACANQITGVPCLIGQSEVQHGAERLHLYSLSLPPPWGRFQPYVHRISDHYTGQSFSPHREL